jgi:hypothetical protein
MSATATAEEIRRGQIGHVDVDVDVDEHHDDAGGGPPTQGPPPARPPGRGYGGSHLPRWQQLLLLGALVILAFVIGTILGGSGPGEQT